jgi:RNA-binding protein
MTPPKTPKPSSSPLQSAALRKLRALGHALTPVVAIGKDGLTDAVVRATDAALTTHELIKVKLQREAPVDRHEAALDLAKRTKSTLAQVIGRTLLLYRRHPKKPKIDLTAKPEKAQKAPKPRRPEPELADGGTGDLGDTGESENPGED